MPQTLAHLFKEYIMKYNEKILHYKDDEPLCDGTGSMVCPITKHADAEKTVHEDNVCKDNLTDLNKITDDIKKNSSDDKCTCMETEHVCGLEYFDEEQCILHPCDDSQFGFQCRQWLDIPEKDLFLNTAFVAQSIRKGKQTLHRDDLCFQWLNSTDKELFLNTAFAAKSSRRRHTR